MIFIGKTERFYPLVQFRVTDSTAQLENFTSLTCQVMVFHGCQPTPFSPRRKKGLIAGLIKGNLWLISPDHKALFLGGGLLWGGGGRLTSRNQISIVFFSYVQLIYVGHPNKTKPTVEDFPFPFEKYVRTCNVDIFLGSTHPGCQSSPGILYFLDRESLYTFIYRWHPGSGVDPRSLKSQPCVSKQLMVNWRLWDSTWRIIPGISKWLTTMVSKSAK